jgi:hypothetical protein
VTIFDFKSIKELVNQVKKIPSVQHVDISSGCGIIFPVNLSFGKIVSQYCHERATDMVKIK